MDYILDTSILIEIENDNKEIISKIAKQTDKSSNLFITYFGFCEYFYGHTKKNKKNKEKILERLEKYSLINTSKDSAIIFCETKNELIEKGNEIPVFDLLSASIAIDKEMTLITLDSHFKRLPRLKTIIID